MAFLIKSTVLLSIFYVFYKVALQKETFFKAIRVYFLIGFLLAISIPFVIFKKYIVLEPLETPLLTTLSNGFREVQQPEPTDWSQVLMVIYFIGVLFFTIRFAAQLTSVVRFLIKNKKSKAGKYLMIESENNQAPFSFFNYIVYNPQQFNKEELKQIIKHEKTHADQMHSIDTILAQFLLIYNWFNPLAWLYNKEIQKNLEFLADGFAQNYSPDKKNYQYLLLKTISPNCQLALINNFYNSLIKKRINMLQKNRSKKVMYFKFAFIIPILIAFIFSFNTKVIAQHKKIKTIEIQEKITSEIITKDFTKDELAQLKSRLAAKGVTFKYSKLKYNSNHEITAIDVRVKSDLGNEAKLSQKGDEAIQPIQIRLNKDTGNISLGNRSNDLSETVFFSDNDAKHKKIFVKKMGTGDENMVWTSSDSTKVIHVKGENGFVFFSGDEDAPMNKQSFTIKKGDSHANVWISKGNDTTKLKHIELIEIEEESDGEQKVIIESLGDGEVDKFIVKTDGKKDGNHSKMMFIDSDSKNALILVDGKEMPQTKIENIDTKNMESIEIIKGDKAVEKYGEKAKDGVILIKTKK